MAPGTGFTLSGVGRALRPRKHGLIDLGLVCEMFIYSVKDSLAASLPSCLGNIFLLAFTSFYLVPTHPHL